MGKAAKKNSSSSGKSTSKRTEETKHADVVTKPQVKPVAPGKRLSGRTWKSKSQPARANNQVKSIKRTLKQIQRDRQRRTALMAQMRELRAEKEAEEEEEKQRIINKRKRKEANEMRSTQYQVITNPKTIKKMQKNAKLARQIHKIAGPVSEEPY